MEGATSEQGHVTDKLELDMSEGEYNLSLTDPVGYSWYVDGVRKIFIKDESIDVRWGIRDGKAYLISLEVF